MSSTHAFLQYLSLDRGYFDFLGKPGWSSTGDAMLVHEQTFVMTLQLSVFLEGFAEQRSLLPFGQMLVLLQWLQQWKVSEWNEVVDGSQAFTRTFSLRGERAVPEIRNRSSMGNFPRLNTRTFPIRNAGALMGHLCQEWQPTRLIEHPLRTRGFLLWLRQRHDLAGLPMHDFVHRPETPSLGAEACRQRLIEAWTQLPSDELSHWLEHGCAPLPDPGETLLESIEAAKPTSIRQVLRELAQSRDRLRGTLALVETMEAALTLPTRTATPQRLPLGGYMDVTTRGTPEHLLPSQFVLEGLEFVRRYAEHELLFFRREEPHALERERYLFLLDQGVRTWGHVRLALTAAFQILASKAERRKAEIRLAVSSRPGHWINPFEVSMEQLGEYLEASDFSLQPTTLVGDLATDDPFVTAAEVILFTHPRSLAEPAVIQAVASWNTPPRGFAVTADEQGSVTLHAFRGKGVVERTRFRVDFSRVGLPPPKTPFTEYTAAGLWQSNTELVPMPFSFGLKSRASHLAFDAQHRWILACGVDGLLCLWPLETMNHPCHPEILPPVRSTAGRITIQAIVGLTNRFVVLASDRNHSMILDYDLLHRRVTLHAPPWPFPSLVYVHAAPALESIVVIDARHMQKFALDLETRGMVTDQVSTETELTTRARQAFQQEHFEQTQHFSVQTVTSGSSSVQAATDANLLAILHADCGRLDLVGHPPLSVQPSREGTYFWEGATLIQVLEADKILAVVWRARGQRLQQLTLLETTTGRMLTTLPMGNDDPPQVELSPDGQRLAYLQRSTRVVVLDPQEPATPLLVTEPARVHGQHRLIYHFSPDGQQEAFDLHFGRCQWSVQRQGTVMSVGRGSPTLEGTMIRNTLTRDWVVIQNRRLQIDPFGQLTVLDAASKQVVCMMIGQGQGLAIWLPDGTRYGSPNLLGGPPTPGALDRIGRTLLETAIHPGEPST